MMHEETISIRPEMDQEEVANLFHKYDLVSAPVVDEQGRLVGRITVDDVLDVVEEEASEDITKMAGIIQHEEIVERSILKISSVRIPWLLVAFVGQMISAKILEYFIPDPHKNMALATCYIPLIMAMAGNIGIQSSTVIIRGLALGDIRLRDTGRRLFQELSVASLNGLIIGLLLFNAVSILHHKPRFGLVLGVALVIVLIVAGLIGTLVPLILKRLKIDPAIATGPFITTSNDVLGLIIYFSFIRTFFTV
jgi:magnesium transporter